MQFLVTDIEFDFDNDDADTVCNSELDVFFIASNFDRKEITERHLGVWEADNEEDLIEEITCSSGWFCLLYTSPSPRDKRQSRMPSSA